MKTKFTSDVEELLAQHNPFDVITLMRLIAGLPEGKRSPINYPQPIPVITGDFIGFRADNPFTVITVVLNPTHNTGEAKVSSDEEKIVLPGGIFEAGKHDTTWGIGINELAEETGLIPDLTHAKRFLHSTRTKVDLRSWCGLNTAHCCNFIVTAPVTGEVNIQDTAEAKKHRWVDVRTVLPEHTKRGHYAYFKAWQAFLERDMPDVLLPILLSDQHPELVIGHPQWV